MTDILTKKDMELLRKKGWNRYEYISLIGTSFGWKKYEKNWMGDDDDLIKERDIKELINLKSKK